MPGGSKLSALRIRASLIGGLAALLFACLGAGPALSAGGKAVGVDPQAQAELGTEIRRLAVGADVFIGEKIVTGARGQVQIVFSDETHLVVGPNSALVLEDYLLRSDQSAGKFAINALNGTFRFVTGNAQKDRYVIRTPTGTIGVRGTAFDFNVDDENGTRVLVFRGAVNMCSAGGTCEMLDDSCEVGQYTNSTSEVLGQGNDLEDEVREEWQDAFTYAQNQQQLRREFWVSQARECLNNTPDFEPLTSLVESGEENAPEEEVAEVVEPTPDAPDPPVVKPPKDKPEKHHHRDRRDRRDRDRGD